jgi:hypothetical protein
MTASLRVTPKLDPQPLEQERWRANTKQGKLLSNRRHSLLRTKALEWLKKNYPDMVRRFRRQCKEEIF